MTRLLLGAVFVLLAADAQAVYIDFRGLTSPVDGVVVLDEGITITFAGGGVRQSTATRFGIDGTGDSDASDLIDGGNGSAEVLGFLVSPAAYLESIVISEFGPSDAGLVEIKGLSPIGLHNGVNTLDILLGSGSGNAIRWTGENLPGDDRGFSVDGFNLRLVTPVNADFDGSGVVDGSDFLIWQRNRGTSAKGIANGDANSSGSIDSLDLSLWKSRFGSASQSLSPVPEPSGLSAIAAIAMGSPLLRRQRHPRGLERE